MLHNPVLSHHHSPCRYLSSSPWVLKEACRLLAEYAVWFGKAEALAAAVAAAVPGASELNQALAGGAPLDGALQLTLMAMGQEAARHEAAQVRGGELGNRFLCG